jgi:hypothetical protein
MAGDYVRGNMVPKTFILKSGIQGLGGSPEVPYAENERRENQGTIKNPNVIWAQKIV